MKIKPIAKPKKKKKISYYQNKADKLLQEVGRQIYKKCCVCGKPMDCLHHAISKGSSSALRYNMTNCVPVCTGCHMSYHNGNILVAQSIIEYIGEDKLKELEYIKNNFKPTKADGLIDIINHFEVILGRKKYE